LVTLTGCAGELDEPLVDGQSVYSAVPFATTLRLPNTLGVPADWAGTAATGASDSGGSSGLGAGTGGTTGTGGTNVGNGMPNCPAPLPAECNGMSVPEIFGNSMHCGGLNCHGSPMEPPVAFADLGYTTTDLARRLSQTLGTGTCEPYTLIDADQAEASLLLNKITADPPVCGAKMPPEGQTLSTEQRNCIIAWVLAEVACL
jgi:hypothetical protein